MISREQTVREDSGGGLSGPYALSLTFTGVLAGSLLLLLVSESCYGGDGHVASVVDDVNGAWSLIDRGDTSNPTNGFQGEGSFWRFEGAVPGDTTVTVTFTDPGGGATVYAEVTGAEWSGVTTLLDHNAVVTPSSDPSGATPTTYDSASLVTSDDALVVAGFADVGYNVWDRSVATPVGASYPASWSANLLSDNDSIFTTDTSGYVTHGTGPLSVVTPPVAPNSPASNAMRDPAGEGFGSAGHVDGYTPGDELEFSVDVLSDAASDQAFFGVQWFNTFDDFWGFDNINNSAPINNAAWTTVSGSLVTSLVRPTLQLNCGNYTFASGADWTNIVLRKKAMTWDWTVVEATNSRDGADAYLLSQGEGTSGAAPSTYDAQIASSFGESMAGFIATFATVAVPPTVLYSAATETDTADSFEPLSPQVILYSAATETDLALGVLPIEPPWLPAPAVPSTGIGRGEHRVFLYERGGASFVGEVGFTSLTYSRRLDDKSTAQVSIGAGTKTFLGDLRGWKHELLIARDDKEVWLGPIHEPEWEPGAVTLPADDLLGWLDNRDIAEDLTMNDVDLATVFARLVHDSMAREPSPGLYAAASLSGVVGDRSYVAAQHQAVGDALRSLGQAGVDYTCILRRLYIGALSLLPSITLTDDTLRSPKVKEGKAATKVTLVGSTTSNIGQPIEAAAGGPNVEMGLLEKTINDPDVMTHDGAVHYARDAYAFLNPAPLYVTGVLAPTAPVDMEHLIPGMHVAAKLSSTDRKVDAVCRLTQVDVTVRPSEQGQQETIAVTLVPVGLEG